MHSSEDDLIGRLSSVPELPSELYGNVLRTLHRAAIIRRAVISTLLVALVGFAGSALAVRQQQIAQKERAELTAEFEVMRAFVNGDDIEQEYAQYALVDYGDL